MYLNEIRIENYKSIQNLIIPVCKYGDSYTSIFVGLNEAGKSNLLEAISLLSDTLNKKTYTYKTICHRDSNEEYVDLYYQYKFDNEDEWKKEFKKKVTCSVKFEKLFKVETYEKNVYLERNKTSFSSQFIINWSDFDLSQFSFALISQTPTPSEKLYIIKSNEEITEAEKANFTILNNDKLIEILEKIAFSDLKINKQELSIWKAEEKYLITKAIDLNTFASDISSSIPLTNLFTLCGFDTQEKINEKITSLTEPETRSLSSQLSNNATKYINDVWKEHKISIDVNIEYSTKRLSVHVYDKDNEAEYFSMLERSQGFQHFISLILHLSISNTKEMCKNQIILIDEPENHLHPSGIRFMRDELLKIGTNNYVFIATHSPFLIDNKNMDRHFIVKKASGNTELTHIKKETILADEEVLRYAFGINVFKDLLAPNKILVEGMSDLNIIRKGLKKLTPDLCFGITNGHGGNIVQIASLLKCSDVECLVVLDDDEDGRKYKDKIIKLGTPFSNENVKTIRDLYGDIIERGTIEDTLNPEYVISKANEIIKSENKTLQYTLSEGSPVIEDIKTFLHKNGLKDKSIEIIKGIKEKIGEDFNPTSLDQHPILKKLLEKIEEHINASK